MKFVSRGDVGAFCSTSPSNTDLKSNGTTLESLSAAQTVFAWTFEGISVIRLHDRSPGPMHEADSRSLGKAMLVQSSSGRTAR